MEMIKRMLRIGFRRLPWNERARRQHIAAQVDAIVNHDDDAWYKLMSNPFTK